jgi:uncharacterized protein
VSVQYRMLRQPARVRFSSLTGWEAPDPAWWAGQGYAVVNCDLRGAGTSEGTCAIWSDQEGEDVYDLIEWAAAQPWSTGAIGMLGSFSDNNLHSRGSFRGWERIASADRFLYTHRGGKWLTFYSPEVSAAQLAFFDRYLRGRDVRSPPRIRLEVRESRDVIRSVRDEQNWPLDGTEWRSLYLTGDGLAGGPAVEDGQLAFGTRTGGACWEWTVPADTEITGPMALRLWVAAHGTDDVSLFAGVEKWRGRSYVPFEGSYGFGRDRVTTGWLKVSLRALDPGESRPFEPVPACTSREPLAPGQVAEADIALGPSATFFRAGDTLRLVVAAAGCGRSTRSPASSRPPTSRARAGNVPCTGDPGGGPGCWSRSSAGGRRHGPVRDNSVATACGRRLR